MISAAVDLCPAFRTFSTAPPRKYSAAENFIGLIAVPGLEDGRRKGYGDLPFCRPHPPIYFTGNFYRSCRRLNYLDFFSPLAAKIFISDSLL